MQNNIIQARFLFEKARILWEPYRDIANGLVVSILQDSAELVLWAISKKYSIQVKDQEGFISILEKIGSSGKTIHGKAHILEINKSRIAFKHYGLSPAHSDIPRFIEGAALFLRENVREHLGLNFETISSADDVVDSELRSFLKEAERFRDDGNLEEALVQASLAFQRILYLANLQFGDLPRLEDAYLLFPRESQEAARELLFSYGRFWERFSIDHAMFKLGVDRALFEEIENRRLIVNVSESGNRLGVYSRSKTAATLENVNFLVLNITEIARRIRISR